MCAAALGYVFEESVLDAVNSVLWIGVVIVLEVELRMRAMQVRSRQALRAIALVLYGGLAVLVYLWASSGMWFDAYDAALWLIAFATLERSLARRLIVQAH